MKALASALVKAQQAFGPALKTHTNPAFRSRYADLSACVEAVLDALTTNGIFLMQQTRECENGVIVETVFLHESGEQLSSGPLHVPATKHDAQGYGSALTYARRYSLMAACGIAPEDDDGNAAVRKPPVARQDPIPETFRSSPTMGAMEAIEDEERRVYLQMLASVVIAKVKAGEVGFAHDKIEAEKFDSDEKTALWSLLDSKTRSSLKDHKKTLAQKQAA